MSVSDERDLLITLISYIKSNNNPVELMIQLKQAFPEIMKTLPDNNEALKIKWDTELAMQKQKIELFEKQHHWDMEKLDKQVSEQTIQTCLALVEKGVQIPDFILSRLMMQSQNENSYMQIRRQKEELDLIIKSKLLEGVKEEIDREKQEATLESLRESNIEKQNIILDSLRKSNEKLKEGLSHE